MWSPGAPGCNRCTVALIHTKHGTKIVQGSSITIETPGALCGPQGPYVAPRGPWIPQVHCCSCPHQTWHKDCSGVFHNNRNTRGPMWPPGSPGYHRCNIALIHTKPGTKFWGLPSQYKHQGPNRNTSGPCGPQGPLAARGAPLL